MTRSSSGLGASSWNCRYAIEGPASPSLFDGDGPFGAAVGGKPRRCLLTRCNLDDAAPMGVVAVVVEFVDLRGMNPAAAVAGAEDAVNSRLHRHLPAWRLPC